MHDTTGNDQHISNGEFTVAFPAIIIGVSILELPSEVASATLFSDGWVAILVSGILFSILAILAVKVAQSFPNDSFFTYTTYLLNKPFAFIVLLCIIIFTTLISSYILRSVAFMSKQYLFTNTPPEVITLTFLLVVIYALCGERIDLFRLNLLFVPIIIFIFLMVGVFSIETFEYENLLPVFKTNLSGYMDGIMQTFSSYYGFGIGLFYVYLLKNKEKVTTCALAGISISTIFYLFIFFYCIAIFGNLATSNLQFPTIELAKRVSIPGGVFERIDAAVFTIWVMAIFNTMTMMLDTSILLIRTQFKKLKRQTVAFILAPIIFYISMFPQTIAQLNSYGSVVGNLATIFHCLIIVLLFTAMKIRGVRSYEKS